MPSVGNTIIDFQEQVAQSISFFSDGIGRYKVSVPFMFHDGGLFVIILKKEGPQWIFSDEGHTLMHCSSAMEGDSPPQRMMKRILPLFQVQNRNGELILPIEDKQYRDAFWSFIQAIIALVSIERRYA